ncbi:hypothetical protein Q8791_23190 [Nocardiopsis sp. CT-R113]|uniref:Uncharacterized protein n=1 Tax=Nocardiopsis codii TaxID=3065942 RepID=A0ABU7KD45_9ACTN|nr:hypothetical protein [Nocardiopsis sp. CT-R113]MEE2040127.1 hypothetical protein [Nocardiopsis sp. CT-R113]
MSRYTQFITARLDEGTNPLPAPVTAALLSIAAMHAGPDECTGCGHTAYEETTPAEQCEQAHEIAAIWADHPDYPGRPTHRALLLNADDDGSVYRSGSEALIAAGLARRTPAGVYLTPRGRALLPADHKAAGRASVLVFDWGRDPFPYPAPAVPTVADVRSYPTFYICGPGRELAENTRCPHEYFLTDSCPGCAADE